MPNSGLRAGHKMTVSDFDAIGIWSLKTSTESVTSSTTLQNDDQLVLPVSASAKYAFEGILYYDGAVGGGLKTAFTVPASATLRWAGSGSDITAAPVASYSTVVATASAGVISYSCIGAGTTQAVHIKGTTVISTTSGNLQLQWAQSASSATATRIFLDSWLRLTRIA